ncbi:hypothetical protein GF337_06775 [candidate division KSB1 bacterium]|nr:hypothetical protein [candidate division KSB1 bacterium]
MKKIVIFGAAIVLIVLVLTFVKTPYTIKAPCRVVAQHEWTLTQIQPDKLTSKLVKNDSNMVQHFSLLQFDRQDFVEFSLTPQLIQGMPVRAGDVMGKMVSSENRLELVNFKGELEKARASYQSLISGEKASLQAEARKAIEYARAKLNAFEPKLKRSRALYQKELISKEESEIAEATYETLRLNVALQEARLRVLQTGEKEESIRIIEADIERLQDQIEVLQNKMAHEVIKSPIDGVIIDPNLEQGVLFQVSKIDSMVLQIPIKEEKRKYVHQGQKVRFYTPDRKLSVSCYVQLVGNQVRLVSGRPMVIVNSVIKNPENRLLPGGSGYAKIYCGKISLWKRLQRELNLYLGSKQIG